MTVSKEIQEYLKAQNFDAIEDAWLTHLEDDADDLDFFIAVGRALERAGEDDRARILLDMVDENLREAEKWPERLRLLKQTGTLLHDAKKLHPQMLKTLGHLYGHYPSYDELLEKVGLRRAVDDIPKSWKKAERLAGLLAFDIGSIVALEGKGAGRVTEVNMALESFKVEFMDHPDLRVGFGGAAKLLKTLEPGHVLRRKLEEPDVLRKLKPAELLRLVLESYDEPRIGAEVKRDVMGLVGEKQWNSWWTTARKHPQVLAAPGGKRAYSWAASSDDAQNAVWRAFEVAPAAARLDLLRQNADRDAELKLRMSKYLARHAAKVAEEDPGVACEIWFGLERYGVIEEDVAWAPLALVPRLTNKELSLTVAAIKDRVHRESIYQIAREKRSDWHDLAVQLMWQETEARALDSLSSSLSPEAFNSIYDQILSQPRKSPAAFTWLVVRAKDEPTWLQRNPVRLLKQILWSLSSEMFTPFRGRLLPQLESGGTLARLMDHLTESQAGQTVETLRKTAALVDYQRGPLLNALYLRYPGLRQDDEAPLYSTPEAIEEKREELRRLAEEEIPENRRAIETAREMGDLRENFEYKSARQRHEYLSARATALDHDLRRVRPIDPSIVDGTEVVLGSRTHFQGGGGKIRMITILGPWNSLPEQDILSNESDLASRLLGSKVGDYAKLDDGATYQIVKIEPHT